MRLGLGRERIVSARRSSLSAMMPPRPTQPRHAILGMETMLVRLHCRLKFLHGVGDVHQMLQRHTRSDWSKRFRTLVRNRLHHPLRMVGRDQGAALLRRGQLRITRPASQWAAATLATAKAWAEISAQLACAPPYRRLIHVAHRRPDARATWMRRASRALRSRRGSTRMSRPSTFSAMHAMRQGRNDPNSGSWRKLHGG